MSERIVPEEAVLLRKALDYIKDEDRWRQYRLVDLDNRVCALGSVYRQECLELGIEPTSDNIYRSAHKTVRRAITAKACRVLQDSAKELFHNNTVTSVNDEIGHPAVMKMFKHAIHKAIEKANVK